MCGRFFLARRADEIAKALGVGNASGLDRWRPRYNIAPSQDILAIVAGEKGMVLELRRWGLIPGWAKDEKIGWKMINARSETIAGKPSFRSAFKKRRCLILADGFYEWKRDAKVKVPHAIRLKSKELLAMAGIWERWQPPKGEEILSAAIVTTGPNSLMEKIHDRMPVIIPRDCWDFWLDPENETRLETLGRLFQPYPAKEMEAFAISTAVNSPKNDSADLLSPL
jgi:putative SOS response-associated peptidase YedK